eukprot:1849680-Pleurochrysis_carterae.AAC.5
MRIVNCNLVSSVRVRALLTSRLATTGSRPRTTPTLPVTSSPQSLPPTCTGDNYFRVAGTRMQPTWKYESRRREMALLRATISYQIAGNSFVSDCGNSFISGCGKQFCIRLRETVLCQIAGNSFVSGCGKQFRIRLREAVLYQIVGLHAGVCCTMMGRSKLDSRRNSPFLLTACTPLTRLLSPLPVIASDAGVVARSWCVEIDIWDGARGDPDVTHGYALVTREKLSAVVAAIWQEAFTVSDTPLIISLEVRCSPKQQARAQHDCPSGFLVALCVSVSPLLLFWACVSASASASAFAFRPALSIALALSFCGWYWLCRDFRLLPALHSILSFFSFLASAPSLASSFLSHLFALSLSAWPALMRCRCCVHIPPDPPNLFLSNPVSPIVSSPFFALLVAFVAPPSLPFLCSSSPFVSPGAQRDDCVWLPVSKLFHLIIGHNIVTRKSLSRREPACRYSPNTWSQARAAQIISSRLGDLLFKPADEGAGELMYLPVEMLKRRIILKGKSAEGRRLTRALLGETLVDRAEKPMASELPRSNWLRSNRPRMCVAAPTSI